MRKIIGIISLIGLVGSLSLSARGRSPETGTPAYSTVITRTFQVNDGAALSLNNKYGKINLSTWNKNEIRAVITITTNATNEQDAKELAGQVYIRTLQADPGSVSLTTDYVAGNKGSFWKQFFGSTPGSSHRSVHIDYVVTIPQSLASLSLHNNYGDVAGSDLPGKVSLVLNYGHFYLSRIGGTLDMKANYCEGTLSGVSRGTIAGNYTDFQFDDVKNVKIRSNYSNYKISRSSLVNLDANYGSFTAQHVDGLTTHSNYTDFKISILDGASDMALTYGNVRIGSLGSHFGGLALKGTYGDVSVGIPRSQPLRVDIRLSKGDIDVKGLSLRKPGENGTAAEGIFSGASPGAGPGAPLIQIRGAYTDVSLTGR